MATKLPNRPVKLVNNISGEEWICDNYANVKIIDGVEFIEVRKPLSLRTFWMNKQALVEVRSGYIN